MKQYKWRKEIQKNATIYETHMAQDKIYSWRTDGVTRRRDTGIKTAGRKWINERNKAKRLNEERR